MVGFTLLGRAFHHLGEGAEFSDQFDFLGQFESRGVEGSAGGHGNALLLGPALDAVGSGMGVLHVIGRVLPPIPILSKIEIKIEMPLGLALDHEKTEDVLAHILH